MKVCYINRGLSGSTGKIVLSLAKELKKRNGSPIAITAEENKESFPQAFATDRHGLTKEFFKIKTKFNGSDGFSNSAETKKALRFLDEQKPDIVHVHNTHGYYLNTKLIFDYCHEKGIPVIWTLHDCWIVTGRCCYFDYNQCDKWKYGCKKCPFKKAYPASYCLDRANKFFKEKRQLLTQENLTLVSPSDWLKSIVITAGIKNDVFVIRNGIDTELFENSAPNEAIKAEAKGRTVIGSVANVWSKQKGLSSLSMLADKLDPKLYYVIAVGIQKSDDLSPNLHCLPKTQNQKALASLYKSFDYFVNLTMEDNFPTVNLESLASGTPVLTYRSGGAAEMIQDHINGLSFTKGDFTSILNFLQSNPISSFKRDEVQKTSQLFKEETMNTAYFSLYQKILDKR
jgi:putative colanic acid biosynthesis glycosyltransferase